MKKINYTGSSKLISRIVHLLNRKAPLPLDGQGDAVWGTNGQVLTTDGNGNTSWTTPQGGGGDVTDVEVNGTSVVDADGVANVTVPTKTSDLNNDSGFITNLVNDLANYYTKSQTYTQAEVNQLISGIVTLNILVVQALPTQDISTTTIYLVPKQDAGTDDIYDEYLYINNAWELIGTTQIDLSNYVTTTDLSTALADYVTSTGLTTILANYALTSSVPTKTSDLTNDSHFVADNPTFTEASTRANIASGESFATILGKIKKWFTDLKSIAFSGSASDVSYDNTSSGLTATDVKNALDEIYGDIPTDFVKKSAGGEFNGNIGINRKDGTVSSVGLSSLSIGNTKAEGEAQNSRGRLDIYSNTAYCARIQAADGFTSNKNINFPNASGIVALIGINNNFTENQTINKKNGTTTSLGVSLLTIGNNIAEGTDENSMGRLVIYGKGNHYAEVFATNVTAHRKFEFPNKAGTLALTSDLDSRVDWVSNGIIGAKNLLPITVDGIKALNAAETWTGNTKTINGITITLNDDGTIKVTGTATANTFTYIFSKANDIQYAPQFKGKILSGCPSGGSASTYRIRCVLFKTSSSSSEYIDGIDDDGNGVTIPNNPEYNYIRIAIRIGSGYQCPTAGLVFKPMIRLATDTDATFQPYAMTNLELTNRISPLTFDNAGSHSSVYRGAYLGTSVTAEQYAAISAGTFDDMYIGDYWTINSVVYRIAAFDYWYNTGDTNCTTHHVVIVPDSAFGNAPINSTNTTTGGYVGSDFYTGNNSNTGKATAVSAIESAFGSAHILTHRELLTNAISGNAASGWSWYDSTVDLMNETMVYGAEANSERKASGLNYNIGIDRTQLPLFRHDPSKITTRNRWRLRSIVSSENFAFVGYDGAANVSGASASIGVRPVFAIKE